MQRTRGLGKAHSDPRTNRVCALCPRGVHAGAARRAPCQLGGLRAAKATALPPQRGNGGHGVARTEAAAAGGSQRRRGVQNGDKKPVVGATRGLHHTGQQATTARRWAIFAHRVRGTDTRADLHAHALHDGKRKHGRGHHPRVTDTMPMEPPMRLTRFRAMGSPQLLPRRASCVSRCRADVRWSPALEPCRAGLMNLDAERVDAGQVHRGGPHT